MKRNHGIAAVMTLLLLFLWTMPMGAMALDEAHTYEIYQAQDIVIDGALDDWDAYQYSYIMLPTQKEQVSYFAAYAGPDDLSGIFWFAWSGDGLYMAAEVTDDNHTLVPGDSSWSGDSIQWAGGFGGGYQPELTLSSDSKVVKNSNDGLAAVSAIQFVSTQEENKTVYEVFFPWSTISPDVPKDTFSFCFLLNENDGKDRVGWIELAPGIATGKVSTDFPVFHLLDEAPAPAENGAERPQVPDLTVVEETGPSENIVYELKVYITYPDIRNHWARAEIDAMASCGVLRGMGELFLPDTAMTRAEVLATMVRAAGLDPAEYQNVATDMPADHWCAAYLQAAADGLLLPEGFMQNGAVLPDRIVMREEVIALFANAYLMRTNGNLVNDTPQFADAGSISDWAAPYVALAQQIGLIKGGAEDYVRPQDVATRAEIATIAYRMAMLVTSVGNE